MGFDEEEDDLNGAPSRPSGPLPPDDRLWRHPSELGGLGRPPAPTAPPEPIRRSRPVTALALASAGLLGAVVVVGALWIAGTTGVDVDPATTAGPAPSLTLAATDRSQAAAVAAAGLTVVEIARGGTRTEATALWLGDGALLVAASLVEDADEVVAMVGGRAMPATVVGTDPATAISALTVTEGGGARVATADPGARGDAVAIVGFPTRDALLADAPRTIAAAIGETDARSTVDGQLLHGTIRLDRALPADATGSLIIDDEGRALGVVVSPAADGGVAVAVPATSALAAGTDLRDDGQVRRAWLGVRAVDLDAAAAQAAGTPVGARLSAVQAGSPAHAGGLVADDVVVAVDGQPIADASDLVLAIAGWEPGERVEITWHRAGEPHRAVITLGG
jgi:S1-C subfamily serine protease